MVNTRSIVVRPDIVYVCAGQATERERSMEKRERDEDPSGSGAPVTTRFRRNRAAAAREEDGGDAVVVLCSGSVYAGERYGYSEREREKEKGGRIFGDEFEGGRRYAAEER